MAASLLESQLNSLHQCLSASSNVSKEQTVGIIEDLHQLCVHEVTEKDIGNCHGVDFL